MFTNKSPIEQGNILKSISEGFIPTNKDKKTYYLLIGVLNWLSIMTRLDIIYVVSNLSRFNNRPGAIYINIAKRVLRYLAGTVNEGLYYGPGGDDNDI